MLVPSTGCSGCDLSCGGGADAMESREGGSPTEGLVPTEEQTLKQQVTLLVVPGFWAAGNSEDKGTGHGRAAPQWDKGKVPAM